MDTAHFSALLHGLAQIPRDGLERLRAHIEAGRPLLLDGLVYRPELEYG